MANQKKLFALIAVADAEKMAAKLVSEFPDTHLKVANGQWLLVGESSVTTTEVSHKLHITDETGTPPTDTPGSAIVLSVSNYYGRASRNIWEWITSKIGGTDGVAG
jgi:hypothetical protein